MEEPAAKIHLVFARALDFPSGAARDEFVADQCSGNPDLRREVESLLQAHDAAGDFLSGTVNHLSDRAPRRTAQPPSGATTVIAATQAELFLRQGQLGSAAELGALLASLPEGIRQEVGERILAGLRIRSLCGGALPRLEESEATAPRLPGFHIERKLGEGSLGVVYAAHDEKLNRRVAIKVLRRCTDDRLGRRVLDEARKAAALVDPSIVTIYSVLDETDPPAIVMEYVEGFALDRFTAQLSFDQKVRVLREVARGLALAHERGLVHRDLKPDNIVVGPDMRPRILDFGLALSLEEAGRQNSGFEGTPLYASPEQVQGKPLTAASDLFSFGSVMFKVLTGRPPFAGETIDQTLEAIATTSPPFLRDVAVGVPEDLQAVCLACLAWNAADRPTAAEVVLELGRFLVGEPVRLKPKLYDDLLRQSVSQYSTQARAWESQSIISHEERDALEIVHRRLLADEDHWIIDARRITLFQTVLSAATWLSVIATLLTVWMLRNDLSPQWRWILPTFFTSILLAAGYAAQRERETLAAATFLAGGTLAILPCMLAWLAEMRLFAIAPEHVTQLFAGTFTNQQVLVSSLAALLVAVACLWRLKMTGFAWTAAALAAASYLSLLLLFDWLDQKPEIQALWCLPLAAMEPVALVLERHGRVRWTLPFHLIALAALVGGLDVIALNGPTLKMLGVSGARWPYFDDGRLTAFSFVLNGLLFLALMLATEKSASLDLRRASKLLEVLAIVHTLSALFVNALNHRAEPHVRADVWFYLGAAGLFTVLAAFRSRWRLLVGGLLGCAFGCYLLVTLDLVARKPFIVGLGLTGLLVALGSFAFVRRRARINRN